MNQPRIQFLLDVRVENQSPVKITVIDTLTAGSDPRNDLVLVGNKFKTKHLIFEKKGENLALHYVGFTNQTFLNSIPLEEKKTYLLEAEDKLQMTGVEIIIRNETVFTPEPLKVKPVVFNSLAELTPESMEDSIIYADNPTGSMLIQPKVRPAFIEQKQKKKEVKEVKKVTAPLTTLWAVKLYAMVADIFFSYAILVVLFPLLLADGFARDILFSLTNMISPMKYQAVLNFVLAWYILSLAQTLIFGSTLGQVLVGLYYNSSNTFGRLILFRIKTFFYAIFLLPAQNDVKNSLVFKGMRKGGMIVIFAFILASPFFLPLPFNTNLTLIANKDQAVKELRTKSIISHSKMLGMTLNSELSLRYYLLPAIVNPSKRGFLLVDLKTNKTLTVHATEDFTYKQLEAQLMYGNPLYNVFQPTSLIDAPIPAKKELIVHTMLFSPDNLLKSAESFGPFFGSAILLKESLITNGATNSLVLKDYLPETPLFFMSTSGLDFFYLFGPKELSRFIIDSVEKGPLYEVFEQDVFTKLSLESTPPSSGSSKSITLLEAQDAFLHGEEETFLTYYVETANSLSNVKIIHDGVDLTDRAKLALLRNIESVQKFIKNKNVHKSFNDIKNQLAPMEKPGD